MIKALNIKWHKISIRLQKELKKEEEPTTRYKTQPIKGKTISFSSDDTMEGIIYFLNQENNNKIEEKINFSSSGLYYGNNENHFPQVPRFILELLFFNHVFLLKKRKKIG